MTIFLVMTIYWMNDTYDDICSDNDDDTLINSIVKSCPLHQGDAGLTAIILHNYYQWYDDDYYHYYRT